MLFIGYLYGIRSETRLVEEVKVNMAYRWFLGYGITDKIPDASVIWQNRVPRIRDDRQERLQGIQVQKRQMCELSKTGRMPDRKAEDQAEFGVRFQDLT